MKTLAKLAILVAVMAFCLPAYSEILIYEYSTNGDYYGRRNGVWEVEIEDDRGYLVIEVMYNTDGTIELNQALYIEYWRDNEGKWFSGLYLRKLVRSHILEQPLELTIFYRRTAN